jgi:putative ABC transport system substrate-binding protein
MRRREFIAGLGSAAAWPLVVRAQQPVRMRRIGVMLGLYAADDPEAQARLTAFVQGLQERGWTDGRNVRIDYRWGLGDADLESSSPKARWISDECERYCTVELSPIRPWWRVAQW